MSAADQNPAPWLTSAELRDWKSLLALVMTVPVTLDNQLKRDAGINSFEYHVLVGLADAPGRSMAMSDLAMLTQGSASRLSHAVSRLERDGLVERRACAEAGRRTSARLTDDGMVLLERVAPAHVREVRRVVIDVLTPEQLAALGECARQIVGVAAPEVAKVLGGDAADAD